MKKIKEPGIYKLSNEEYHDQEALNKSGLVQLSKSPAHFNEWYNAPNEEPTNAMVIGTATHTAILEPDTHALRQHLNVAASRSKGKYVFTMKSGRTFDVDSFRKNPWTQAFKKAGLSYKVPYSIRHTFAAWAMTLRMDPNKLVNLMGHSSKKMVYEVYGNYVEGLETDAGMILNYFGKDFIGLNKNTTLPFAKIYGESFGESRQVVKDNIL